jgi:hypothetical protein
MAGPSGNYVFDPSIPLDPSNPSWGAGVVLYQAYEQNIQSVNNQRPLTVLPPGRMLQVGEEFYDPKRTLRISVTDRLANRPAKYRVRVEWGPVPKPDPDGQFDLRITPWNDDWETPDIWVNSTKNDEADPPNAPRIIYENHAFLDETTPIGNGDPPWVMHSNTLYARVTNQGKVETPEPVMVSFYLNTPPGVGDNGTFELFDTVDAGKLGPGESRIVAANRPWIPFEDEHTCVKVEIHRQPGEVSINNNVAQENFCDFETGAASPYAPIELDFLAQNPYTAPGVMDIRARNVPKDWYVALDHGSVWLGPLEEKTVHAVVWTDRVAEWEPGFHQVTQTNGPRKAQIKIEGWMDRFTDQVFPVGGFTTFMRAVRKVEVSIKQASGHVDQPFLLNVRVIPGTGVVPLAIHITDPDGLLHTERAETDTESVFAGETRYKATKPGLYRIQVFTLRGSLAGEAESSITDLVVE